MRPKTTFGCLCTLLALLTAAGCAPGSPGGSATSLPVSSATSLPSSSAIEVTSTALADAGEMVIQIHGPTLAPLGERTTLTITSADAVRLEWTAPGFDGGAVDPFREAAQITVEPDDAGQVGQSVTLVVTGYDFNGNAAQAHHVFEVTPARTATPPPATPLPAGLRALPVQMPPEEERIHMEALLEGELRLVNGCLRVGEEYAGQEGELIVWPPGFWAAAEDGVIVVYDPDGQAVARVGDWVRLGGGEVFQLFQSPTAIESVVEQPPAECPGPYWIVGEIVLEPTVAALPTTTPLSGGEESMGLVMDTRPVETAAGEVVDLTSAPLTPLGGLMGVVESWQDESAAFRFTLITDAGETTLIRGEPFRTHFRGQPIDTWFNSDTVERPQPGERVYVTGRVVAPNEVVAGNITIERDGLMQTWFSETLVELAPYWAEENGFPTNAVVSAADVPHLWLRGPLQTMVGLLTDDAEPPTLPAAWQPYADRTALVYGTINPDNQHMEVKEVYVQDGPCDVSPATTHCQNWLQLLPEAVSDN